LGGQGDLSIYQFGIGASGACHANINTTAVGEVASWTLTLRRFDAPVPTVYARAQIENTALEVGAIGPAAEEIERLLGQLTRLTPESAALDQINRGLKAWDEYFQRGFE